MAKRYFVEHDIAFEEYDVTVDRAACREALLMTGRNGVPVITVGSRAMLGWDLEEFERLRSPRRTVHPPRAF